MGDPYRQYAVHELGADGYPTAWHKNEQTTPAPTPLTRAIEDALDRGIREGIDFTSGVKHLVRAEAGHRCERCRHPFMVGNSPANWSPCDDLCDHAGPIRWARERQHWTESDTVPAPPGALVEASWRVLTVHHLNGIKQDLRWWNLAALCQRCHLAIQGRVDMERAFIFEHSPWFRIHAAGWYAVKYLDQDLGREECAARLDELLGLERLV